LKTCAVDAAHRTSLFETNGRGGPKIADQTSRNEKTAETKQNELRTDNECSTED